eukprot:Em0017g351a
MLNPRNYSQVWWMLWELTSRVMFGFDALESFDEEVSQCFVLCSAFEVSDDACIQAQSVAFDSLGYHAVTCRHGKEMWRLASLLAVHLPFPKSTVVAKIYGRLNMALIRTIARAILTRELPP